MFKFKEITNDVHFLKESSKIIREYSWGLDYPVDPLYELKGSDFVIGCFDDDKLIGLASLNRIASPDKIDNGFIWFANSVIVPGYRENGIYTEFYNRRARYIKDSKESIVFTCTDNPIVERFLKKRGWVVRRITKDESGGECKVFEINPDILLNFS